MDVFVPRRFREASFDTYELRGNNRRLFAAAKRFADSYTPETERGLMLAGTVGIGKTHLAVAIGRALAERGFWCYWRNFAKVCTEIKASWKGVGSYSEAMIKQPLLDKAPLILDDLGAEMRDKTDQGWTTELVYEIVQTRYEAMLPTIITTNLTLEDIADRYTDRTASRLAEMCEVVWVSAEDYRLGGGENG